MKQIHQIYAQPLEFTELGLSARESKVYLALLQHGEVVPAALADLAGIPLNKLYSTLHQLWERGFVQQKISGRRKFYTAIEPETAVRNIMDQSREREAVRQDGYRQMVEKLNPLFLAGQPATRELSYFSFIKNPALIQRRFTELQEKVHMEMLLFSKGPYVVKPNDNLGELSALQRTVTVKVIYEVNEAVSKPFQSTVRRYTAAGEQARVHPELPGKLAIFDRRTILLSLSDPATTQPSMITLLIEHPDLALMLRKNFEFYWAEAIDWTSFLEAGLANPEALPRNVTVPKSTQLR